jgi:shikimate dehydrogenase
MKSGSSYVVGLIGSGIQASRTPSMHEQEAAAHGLRCDYRLIDLDKRELNADALPDLLEEAEAEGFTGLNITYPCKQKVMGLLHELSDDARAIGAVNTVVYSDGKRAGYNTDWSGFAASFQRDLRDVEKDRVIQLGAGGAGAAVAQAMLTLGTGALAIFDVDSARAQHLAHELCKRFGEKRATAVTDLDTAVAASDGLVHATPTGMLKYPGLPVPPALLRPALWVAEIVYFPLETELLRVARARGCRTMNGSGMAVFQAAEAFRLFTGISPDVERMQRHFNSMGTK